MTSPRFIPPHLRESLFRSYEPLIARAVTSFPAETSFSVPSNVAPATFVARFRDAILSYKLYSWESDLMSAPLADDTRPDDTVAKKLIRLGLEKSYAIAQDATGLVWFRHRGKAGRPNLLTSEARTHTDPTSLPSGLVPFRDMTEPEISSLCLLVHTKRLPGPHAIVGTVRPEFVDEMTSTFDVALVFHPDKNLTIIT